MAAQSNGAKERPPSHDEFIAFEESMALRQELSSLRPASAPSADGSFGLAPVDAENTPNRKPLRL